MPSSASSRSRTARYRENLRRKGLRPVQIWVPDTTAPGFAEEIRRQCEAIDAADDEDGTMDWIERVSIFDEDDEG